MMGVPTSTVWPSGTKSATTTPAYGEGNSTRDLAVSISTTMSLMAIVSPTDDLPTHDVGLGQAFPDVGQAILRHA